MSIRGLVGMIVAGLVAMAVVIWGRREPVPAAELPAPAPEKPWLSRAAEDQLLGPGGSLGPLFTGVTLGGLAPSADVRAQIAAFARENDVSIDFEVVDDELVAIRFDVTFGGCCGYEGVDALGARIGRPKHLGGCGGEQTYFYDNWAMTHDDGTHVRATVRVNRLTLRWERTVSLDEVLARAEHALGSDRAALATTAKDRWLELETGKRYLLEVPYAFVKHDWQPARSRSADRGIELVTDRRIVTTVTLTTPEDRARLKARWGKPRITGVDTWMWHTHDRTIVAMFEDEHATITLSQR